MKKSEGIKKYKLVVKNSQGDLSIGNVAKHIEMTMYGAR